MTTPSNEDIIAGFLRGDPECNRLVRSWIEVAVSILARGYSIDREDLASESFIAVHDSLSRGLYRGAGLRAYIQQICSHKFLDQVRANRRLSSVDPADLPDIPSESLSADERALRILRTKRLREGLARLDEMDQLAVLLWNQHVPAEEFAQRLNTTYGAARKRVCLAVKKLRAIIAKREKH